jgi:hypothetical protein
MSSESEEQDKERDRDQDGRDDSEERDGGTGSDNDDDNDREDDGGDGGGGRGSDDDDDGAASFFDNDRSSGRSSGGESFFDQDNDTRDLFTRTWGDLAADRWAAERDADLSSPSWRSEGRDLDDVRRQNKQPTWVERMAQQATAFGTPDVRADRVAPSSFNYNNPQVQNILNRAATAAWERQSGITDPTVQDMDGMRNYVESWKGMFRAGEKPLGFEQVQSALQQGQGQPTARPVQALGYQDPSRAFRGRAWSVAWSRARLTRSTRTSARWRGRTVVPCRLGRP